MAPTINSELQEATAIGQRGGRAARGSWLLLGLDPTRGQPGRGLKVFAIPSPAAHPRRRQKRLEDQKNNQIYKGSKRLFLPLQRM